MRFDKYSVADQETTVANGVGLGVVVASVIGSLVITGVIPTDAIFGSPIAAETLSETPTPVPIVVNDALSKITSDDIQKIIERTSRLNLANRVRWIPVRL